MISEEQKQELLKRINAVVGAEKDLTREAAVQFRLGIKLNRYEEAEKEVNITNAELAAFILTLEIQARK